MKKLIIGEIKKATFTLSAMALLVGGVACNKNENKGEQEMKITEATKEKVNDAIETTREAATAVKDAGSEAWDEFSGFTVDKKEAAAEFLNKQIANADQKLESLRVKAENVGDSSKAALDKSIAALKEKKADLALQVEKTKNATSESWSEVRLETQKKWNAFSESLHELSLKLKGS